MSRQQMLSSVTISHSVTADAVVGQARSPTVGPVVCTDVAKVASAGLEEAG